jgi:hypothetical protein
MLLPSASASSNDEGLPTEVKPLLMPGLLTQAVHLATVPIRELFLTLLNDTSSTAKLM